MDEDFMPVHVRDSNMQTHFNFWTNTFLHLLEQIGYYQRRNCMRLVVFEKAVMVECIWATERREEANNQTDRKVFILCVPCRDAQESLRSFNMTAISGLVARAY